MRTSRIVILTILVLTAAAAASEYFRMSEQAEARDRDLLQRAVATVGSGSGTLEVAETAQTIVDEDGWPDPRRFRVLADRLLDQPGVLAVAAERLVLEAERARFEAETGREIVGLNPKGEFVPMDPGDMYLPIVYVHPVSFSEILGRDMLGDMVRRSTALRARDTGRVAMTSPIPLGQDNRPGVLLIAPLYSLGSPVDTIAERREAFVGSVSIGIFSDAFLAELRGPLPGGTRISITDDGRLVGETDPAPEAGAATEVTVGGRTWSITVAHPNRGSMVPIGAILIGGLLFAGVVWLAFRRSVIQSNRLADAYAELAAVVGNMQRRLLRDQADMAEDGVSTVVRYVPAAEHARLGGDWYDVFRATDGALVFTIGDVAGHGVDAVVQMQRIRQSVSAYAFEGRSPAEVLALTEGSLKTVQPGSRMATVWVGRLETETGALVYASAGHLPAIVSCPDGISRRLKPAGGPPLNSGIPFATWNEYVDELGDGCVVAAYTDGVIEARRVPIDEGIDRVAQLLEDPSRPLDDVADEMLSGRPAPGADDAALVIVRLERATSAVTHSARTDRGVADRSALTSATPVGVDGPSVPRAVDDAKESSARHLPRDHRQAIIEGEDSGE